MSDIGTPYGKAVRAARLTLVLNLLLCTAKIATGWFGDSFALIADGVKANEVERLTSDMLLYATERRLVTESVDPSAVMHEVLELFQDTAQHEGIELVPNYDEGIGSVPADRHMLYRAVQNLAANAIDQYPKTGDRHLVAFRDMPFARIKSFVISITLEPLAHIRNARSNGYAVFVNRCLT